METNVMAINNDVVDIMSDEKGLDLLVAQAEKRVLALKKILGVAVTRTTSKDWVDQQGHPYLTASGAEKIAPVFGVKMDEPKAEREDREDDAGKYYLYTFTARFFWGGGSLYAIGTCSSRDKFFAWDSKEQTYKALSEVDENNIKKAAYSNLLVNGVTRVLGIRNLEWKDLEGYGISREGAAHVEYKNGKAGSGFISEAQAKRLYAIWKARGIDDDTVKEFLHENYKITTTKEIKKTDYEAIIKWVEEYREPGIEG